jgi:uncharacterized repeat protein (TIGR04076 family)
LKTIAPGPTTPTQADGPGARPSTPEAGPGPSPSETRRPGFELYDLRVEVVGPADRTIYCGAKLGDYFELHGEMLKLPPGQGFSIYSLAALLPLLPAKQRVTDPNDWMTSDAEVACPDPNCPTRFRIIRTGRRYFERSEVTAVPLPTQGPKDPWAGPK